MILTRGFNKENNSGMFWKKDVSCSLIFILFKASLESSSSSSIGIDYFCLRATHDNHFEFRISRISVGKFSSNFLYVNSPAHVLYIGSAQEVVLHVPALPGVVSLAGPLGPPVSPTTTGNVLGDTVVRPSTGTRHHGIYPL